MSQVKLIAAAANIAEDAEANDALTGLSTAAARRIVRTGKFASGEKASKSDIARIAKSYDIKAKGSAASEAKSAETKSTKSKSSTAPKAKSSSKSTASVQKSKVAPMPVSPTTTEKKKSAEKSKSRSAK